MIDYIIILLTFLAILIPTKTILLMYQQNRYENYRYYIWLKLNYLIKIHILDILVLLIALIFNKYKIIIILSLLIKILFDYHTMKKTKYIKPLVFTNRVKRQIITFIILDILIIGIIASINITYALIVSLFINDYLIFIVGLINTPIEKMFHNKFKKEAKDILFSYHKLKKIGITGSYGKTSSKNIIQEVLSNDYYSLMTPASFNTPMGISRTIRENLKPLHQVFICEMGADHVGDISELMEFVKPSIGVVTSIGPQHLNTFKTIDNIINEKMQIVEMLPSDGLAVINNDNEYIKNYKIKNNVKTVSVGILNDADYRAINISYHKLGSSFQIKYQNEIYNFKTKLLGTHNITNILVAVAIGRQLNISFEKLIASIESCPYIKHRLELKQINGLTFIDNAFNSNPSGSKMSLDVISKMDQRRIIVTPGLIDLGNLQDKYNYEFGKYMLDKVDMVILVGKTQTIKIYQGLKDAGYDLNNVIIKDTVKEAFDYLYGIATKSDTILLENDLPDAFNK